MKVDFSKIKLVSLDDKPVQDPDGKTVEAHKLVANAIYTKIKTLDLVSVAFEINKGESVELSKTDLNEIKSLFGLESGFVSFVRKAIIDFIDDHQVRLIKHMWIF